ncbi:MAG: hypothetical protein R3C16_01295 [Hyphomonadaceae bacterium]
MKKLAMMTAAAMAMMAPPALAAGHLGLSYDLTDGDIGADDVSTWQAEGAFGFNAGGFGGQFDGEIGTSDDDAGVDADHITAAGHLFFSGSSWRLGGGIAYTNVDFGGAGEVDEIAYGIEGTFDITPNAVLSGSYSVGEVDLFGDIDTWNLDAGAAFYFSPNFRLDVNAGVGNLDAGGGADFDSEQYGLGVEFAPFASTPISFTAGLQHFEVDNLLGGLDSDSLTAGVRWNFGGGSIRDRDNATPMNLRTGLYQRALNLR